ncbi:MAG: oxidoreductase [Actinomycetota bacterium]
MGNDVDALAQPIELPCGIVLRNRIVKAAMSDSLGDGAGDPTEEQISLYRRWALGGVGLSIIGEVQFDPRYPEQAGNLVLGQGSDESAFSRLAAAGAEGASQLWPQLGHAGALAPVALSEPAGPSALDIEGLVCRALTADEIGDLPARYADAAARAQSFGFGGVEVHAGHGFLLSQFLSPLFNHRTDGYGGSVEARCRVLVEIVDAIRVAVGEGFAIGIKINSSDQLDGGLTEEDSLTAIEILADRSFDLIDISGGTYFPGAESSSDRSSAGPYFVDFARRARELVSTPIMVTGGFKTRGEAAAAVHSAAADVVGVARAMVLDPELTSRWLARPASDPVFPRFASSPPGGVTAWYTMRLAEVARGEESDSAVPLSDSVLEDALRHFEERDRERVPIWQARFSN